MHDRQNRESSYVEVEGTILAADQLDMLCNVAGKEFWVTGGVIFNALSRPGFDSRTIVLPRWLARYQKLL